MTDASTPDVRAGVRHEALLYATFDAFVEQVGAFVDDGDRAGEPVLVLVDRQKADALREHLGRRELVHYGNITTVGANPARLLPTWQSFVNDVTGGQSAGPASVAGVPARGVGEPAWPGRTPAELAECALHEALMNLALANSGSGHLLCPYDAAQLDPGTVEAAAHLHPVLRTVEGAVVPNARYLGSEAALAMFAEPLEPPPDGVVALDFEAASLVGLRHHVHAEARRLGLGLDRADDLALAVDEVASNSVSHGGGRGVLRVWLDGRILVCEVTDAGRLPHPLVGRHRPLPTQEGGWGLLIANQLCDLVQVRSPSSGAVARLHMHLP